MNQRLHLIAATPEDLPPLSAVLQDATLRLADIAWDRRGRRLVALLNRFRHEAGAPSRVRSALRIECVERVQRQGWPRDPEAVLALLSVTQDGDWLLLSFAGGATVRVAAECTELLLEDLSEPWPTTRVPRHPEP